MVTKFNMSNRVVDLVMGFFKTFCSELCFSFNLDVDLFKEIHEFYINYSIWSTIN